MTSLNKTKLTCTWFQTPDSSVELEGYFYVSYLGVEFEVEDIEGVSVDISTYGWDQINEQIMDRLIDLAEFQDEEQAYKLYREKQDEN